MAQPRTKLWPKEFEHPRSPRDIEKLKHTDRKLQLEIGQDVIDLFFDDDDDSEAGHVNVDDVTKSCQGFGRRVAELERGAKGPGDRHSIWLDYRRCNGPEDRGEVLVPNKLGTPTSLYRVLNKKARTLNPPTPSKLST